MTLQRSKELAGYQDIELSYRSKFCLITISFICMSLYITFIAIYVCYDIIIINTIPNFVEIKIKPVTCLRDVPPG